MHLPAPASAHLWCTGEGTPHRQSACLHLSTVVNFVCSVTCSLCCGHLAFYHNQLFDQGPLIVGSALKKEGVLETILSLLPNAVPRGHGKLSDSESEPSTDEETAAANAKVL